MSARQPQADELMPGLAATEYIFAPLHRLWAAEAHRLAGANIGNHGCRLTITFLCLNRANLSVRLLASLREQCSWFDGELLIVDQGSHPNELDQVRAACEQLACRWRIIELHDNYGVAGGRNRTMDHVETEWVMCLDNDMIFVADAIGQIQSDIALLGCHFLNLPMLDRDRKTIFAKGGHLHTDFFNGRLFVGGGSAFKPVEHGGAGGAPFLSTFLFGGASVFKAATFRRLGGYDESMFVGFEDIDFSLRLFREGQKIGNTRAVALVHDHPPPDDEDDANYERRRFSREVLKRSAAYLEAKHGVCIWSDGVDDWLAQRQRELGIADESPAESRKHEPALPADADRKDRIRIALVVDTEGWAFWNITQQICRHLGDQFDFQVFCTKPLENAAQLFFAVRDFDIVHIFWREYLQLLAEEHCRTYIDWAGCSYERFLRDVVKRPILSTCVYDHLHLGRDARRERGAVFGEFVDAYYVGSNKLRRIYRDHDEFPDPAAVIEDGVDPRLFFPKNLERFDAVADRPMVVGWVGNSEWGDPKVDYKGVRTILRPAVEQLIADGFPLELKLVDRAEGGMIPHDEMVDFYAEIDVFVCSSEIEGTPNPVLESLACGVPVISTDVGIVPDAFGPIQTEFILAERSVACLQDALKRLLANPGELRRLSAENLVSARDWYWERRVQGFATYFRECLARRTREV
jgi:glycosyltransferase involved in cell wall biosynthesis/GT2 family glycosyltransferase